MPKPVDQDAEDKKAKKAASRKLPKIFRQEVAIFDVDMRVMRHWIRKELDELLKDDDIVVDYLCELLVAEDTPDVRHIHRQLTEFLGEADSLDFCTRLWTLLVSAARASDGIAPELVAQKSEERTKAGEAPGRGARPATDSRGRERPQPKTNYNRAPMHARPSRTRSPNRDARAYRDRD
ncbi:U1 small nuclear ribonucleoprotein component SNU71 [[Candida] zeylanoides]|jgi:serine/arginine repetitive matrix protein 1